MPFLKSMLVSRKGLAPVHFAENLNYSRQWPFPRGMPALLWGTMQMGLAAFRAQAAMPFEEAGHQPRLVLYDGDAGTATMQAARSLQPQKAATNDHSLAHRLRPCDQQFDIVEAAKGEDVCQANMLLTFSQFERELIADRVRDGILTRKKHGKWHGGGPPFGYVVKDGCLRIHDDEAQIVRFIFDEFLRTERYVAVTTKVRELGLRSSAKLTKHGKRRDDRPLSAGQVYHIIRNPIYVGEIHGKGKTYPGQHEPIISREIWERAVAISASRENETPHNKETDHFLAGLLWDDCGRHMLLATDWYRGKCYFRYASSNANWSRREFRRAYRCNAGRLDQFALSSVAEFLCDRLVLRAALKKLGVYGKELDDLVSKGEEAADRLTNLPVRELEAVFAALLVRIEIGHEHIDFTFRSLELRRFLRWKGSTRFRPRKTEWSLSEATFVHEVAATIVSCERIPVINLAPRDRSKCLTPNEELVQLLNKARSAQQLVDQHRDVEIRKLSDGGKGYSCIAEVRMIETINKGEAMTRFMVPGDTVRIEMRDADNRSIFGAIEQKVVDV